MGVRDWVYCHCVVEVVGGVLCAELLYLVELRYSDVDDLVGCRV